MPGCISLLLLHTSSPQNNKHASFLTILHTQLQIKDSEEDSGGTEIGVAFRLGGSGKGLKRDVLGGGLKPQTRGRHSSGKVGKLKERKTAGNSNMKQWGELGELPKN